MPSIPWIIKITTDQSDKVSAHLRRGLEPYDLIGGVCRIRLLGNLEKDENHFKPYLAKHTIFFNLLCNNIFTSVSSQSVQLY